MMTKTLIATCCLVFAVCHQASAQTPPAAPPTAANPSGCAPAAIAPGQSGSAKPGITTGQGRPLGEKLADSNGVLCPPTGIDPEMRAPTPQTGTMRVIPPPGTPGGDPTVQPK
ncbi:MULTISPECIES: hypothetical protein [Rhodopseudomonas]|uniref:hypothetical protein n=1 Tax=Rhodopseudomonas TaxID=1073 RepID=UPI0009B9329A|nr:MULTISPECIES: hypothetical protein [Rhodopseudomonas]MDF3813274.1 hypothetical protein [Rhodopseudomonas sp. BAL398]WOK17582.1 hypothetical protein RBJ75_26270 [Rhodopseudomonas sp. BAL398]